MQPLNRREWIATTAAMASSGVMAQETKVKAVDSDTGRVVHGIEVLLPRNRVPVSFVVDDSTCLVNMGHFCNPQFAEAWPESNEYKKTWRSWPREIPDAFVREFGEWCAEHNVKGKYSIVPFPACVGRLDRELPGWTRAELNQSLRLVRELIVPNWDIHPEMITHTRVIDLKTGHPINEINNRTMENSYPGVKKSVDELAEYMAYALRILKNCGLPCEGVTTPGGFGNAVKAELPIAVHQAVRSVFGTDLPHYFKYVEEGKNTQPRLEAMSRTANDLQLTMNVPAATGDWFGGWQGVRKVQRDRYMTADGKRGRMADQIHRREPAVMLCHWPGMYCNGSKAGFHAFQSIVETINQVHGDETIWMKLSEIGRYWAAKELTTIQRFPDRLVFNAPFDTSNFTLRLPSQKHNGVFLRSNDRVDPLVSVGAIASLTGQSFLERTSDSGEKEITVCFSLPKGKSTLLFSAPN